MELAQLMLVSSRYGCSDLCLAFCKYLLNKIKDVHETNHPVPEVKEIPGHMILDQELLITFQSLETSCAKCQYTRWAVS